MGVALTTFIGGSSGAWRVARIDGVRGPTLPRVARVALVEGPGARPAPEAVWTLRGVASHERYVNRVERSALTSRQPALGRPEATQAALIPITKSAAWWELTQEDRRRIFEEDSHHIATGLEYLPAIARRLYHSRDLGEPFDFLTWFEFAPHHGSEFDQLVGRLRASAEWTYVTREVDIRLTR